MPKKHPNPNAPPKVTMLLGNNGVMLRVRDKETMQDAVVLHLENDEHTVRVQIAGNGEFALHDYEPVVHWMKCVVQLMSHKMTMRFCGEQIALIAHYVTTFGEPVQRGDVA